MKADDYRQIMDFFFSSPEVPEDLGKDFRAWLAAHGDDPDVVQQLERQWDSATAGTDIQASLGRLHDMISGRSRQGWRKRWRNMLGLCAAVASAAVLFAAGYMVSAFTAKAERETVLMASSEDIGTYTLPDGTMVWLNRDSRLRYTDSFGTDRRAVTLEGEAYFEVTKDPGSPFVVNMDNGIGLTVLGTSFNACGYGRGNTVDIILRSGSVQVGDRISGENVILHPDQRYVKKGGNTEISHVDAGACCRWYEKKIVFDNVRLGDVLENISHRYRIEIQANIGELADKRMSMTISGEPLGDVLSVLTSLLPVKCSINDRQLTIEKKR